MRGRHRRGRCEIMKRPRQNAGANFYFGAVLVPVAPKNSIYNQNQIFANKIFCSDWSQCFQGFPVTTINRYFQAFSLVPIIYQYIPRPLISRGGGFFVPVLVPEVFS